MMSAQRKKQENIDSELAEDNIVRNTRPNIDHLLKRINLERKKERTNTITMMVVGIITIAILSLVLTQ